MKKTLYIFEFSREDCDNESEWFVAESGLDWDKKNELAYAHLVGTVYEGFDNDLMTTEDVKQRATVEVVYEVDSEMIEEIIKSRGK